MSRTIELPDEVYQRIEAEASTAGTTPAAWIAAQLTNGTSNGSGSTSEAADPASGPVYVTSKGEPARTLADLMEGLIGTVSSDGSTSLSRNHSALFGDGLEEKRRAGRL